jgi:hypothetical protein
MTTIALELSLPVALSMFSDLLGKRVTGQETAAVDLADEGARVRGVYQCEGRAGAVYLMDVSLAASIGAALVMMPAGLVEECVQAQALPPMLVDNTHEVLNVASRLINRAGGAHYKLREQVLPGQPLPEDAASVLSDASLRTDLQLTVEGYGSGLLTILVA